MKKNGYPAKNGKTCGKRRKQLLPLPAEKRWPMMNSANPKVLRPTLQRRRKVEARTIKIPTEIRAAEKRIDEYNAHNPYENTRRQIERITAFMDSEKSYRENVETILRTRPQQRQQLLESLRKRQHQAAELKEWHQELKRRIQDYNTVNKFFQHAPAMDMELHNQVEKRVNRQQEWINQQAKALEKKLRKGRIIRIAQKTIGFFRSKKTAGTRLPAQLQRMTHSQKLQSLDRMVKSATPFLDTHAPIDPMQKFERIRGFLLRKRGLLQALASSPATPEQKQRALRAFRQDVQDYRKWLNEYETFWKNWTLIEQLQEETDAELEPDIAEKAERFMTTIMRGEKQKIAPRLSIIELQSGLAEAEKDAKKIARKIR